MLMQNCSSFLIKRNKQTCSTPRNNLKALDSCYNWLIYHKTVGMEPAAQGRDIVVIMKWRLASKNPSPPTCRPPSTRSPGPPSAASDT
uniref:Uncharacterized protein n=3 Tax=Canis lupus TaxID=9612 RepID=A0A8I3PZG8_CANLF